MGRWVTPDGEVNDLKQYVVVLPDNDGLRAAFFGAFLLLCEADNWEKLGDLDPVDCAAFFEYSWLFTFVPGQGLQEIP